MAQIKKVNIKGVEYDIAGSGSSTTDTAYVENKTLYIEEGTTTGDVKSTQIIEDQGKLEIATYDSQGNVINSNDSPNTLIQRRLDKPSAEFDSSTNPTGLTAWWNTNFPKMYRGQIVSIKSVYLGKRYYFVVNEKDDTTVTFTPLSPILRSGEGLIADVVMGVDYTITVHLINAYTNQLSEERLNFSFSGMRLY